MFFAWAWGGGGLACASRSQPLAPTCPEPANHACCPVNGPLQEVEALQLDLYDHYLRDPEKVGRSTMPAVPAGVFPPLSLAMLCLVLRDLHGSVASQVLCLPSAPHASSLPAPPTLANQAAEIGVPQAEDDDRVGSRMATLIDIQVSMLGRKAVCLAYLHAGSAG